VKLILLFFLFLPFLSLAQAPIFDYGTKSNEARKAYHTGWEQVLDLGQWTKAEKSFLRAVSMGADFKFDWSQVGRISKDPKDECRFMQSLKILYAIQYG